VGVLVPRRAGQSTPCFAAHHDLAARPPAPAAEVYLHELAASDPLKPVHGLEKNLSEGLRSACRQDYPDYQVVLSAQRPNDPAIPLLLEIQREFGAERVTVAIENCQAGTNGKINNLIGALKHARHDILIISDSDVRLRPDYLKTIVAPLADPGVGSPAHSTRRLCADSWFEKWNC